MLNLRLVENSRSDHGERHKLQSRWHRNYRSARFVDPEGKDEYVGANPQPPQCLHGRRFLLDRDGRPGQTLAG